MFWNLEEWQGIKKGGKKDKKEKRMCTCVEEKKRGKKKREKKEEKRKKEMPYVEDKKRGGKKGKKNNEILSQYFHNKS